MNVAAYHSNGNLMDNVGHVSAPLSLSVLFHGFFLFFAIVNLPLFQNKSTIIDTAISIEILINDKSKTETALKHQPPKNEAMEPPPMKKAPPKMTALKPPKPWAPTPPDVEDITIPSKEPAPKPMEKTKTAHFDKPPVPPKSPVRRYRKAEDEQKLTSLLRNLQKSKPLLLNDKKDIERPAKPMLLASSTNNHVTRGELSALKQQLSGCWNVPSGARNAETLVVELRIFVNWDRTVRSVQIVDQIRNKVDSHYRAAAESARRAVMDPRCSPLELPPEKYDQWKVIKMRFDPSEML